jgi:hypothetical protein
MSTEPESKIPEPRPPKCPYCQKGMPMVVLYPYQIGALLIPSIQCPWCAVMLHMMVITPQPAKEPETPPETPRVVLPS